MTDEEIAQIARIEHVTEEDVRRFAVDHERIKQVKQKYPWCTEQQAVMYLIDDEKFIME